MFIPEIPGKIFNTPVKNIPDMDRPEIKFSGPTRPENILKNMPRPWTDIGPVRSGETRGFGLPRRSLGYRYTQPHGMKNKTAGFQAFWKLLGWYHND